jgi:GNAT superfamily N-acetyltransferase
VSSAALPSQPPGYSRPVNLRTDLSALADLIELVFASTMDENGRSAIREMRAMSHLGSAVGLLSRLNELALGIGLGYVWMVDERLVGNVSIYPATAPYRPGEAWIIANVGVHPDFQRQGIARILMNTALDAIYARKGRWALLQVDYDNHRAIDLYRSLGFVQERAFTTWQRHSMSLPPRAMDDAGDFITRRRANEWMREFEFIERLRPADQGGIGWQRPLHKSLFRKPLLSQLWDWVTLNSTERLVIRSEDESQLFSAAWIENSLSGMRTRLTLFNDPALPTHYAESMLYGLIRRFRTTSLTIEHPYDDLLTTDLLRRTHFIPERTLWHMRYDVPH